MTSIPDIDTDRLTGFKKMAHAVVDDLVEAATDMANRHTHQVDLLKARVAEQDETIEKQRGAVHALRGEMNDAATVLGEAIGADVPTLAKAVPAAVETIATLKHRIAEVQVQLDKAAADGTPEFFGLTVADLAEVLKEEAGGEDDTAVAACLEHDDGDIAVVDTVRNLCSEVRRLRRELDVATSLTANVAPKKARAVAELAAIPMEQGPFVITIKLPSGRRWWDAEAREWTKDLHLAVRLPTRADADAIKPRRSAVVTIDDALDLVQAEKVTSIAPSAAAPGPEAA